MVFLPNLLTLYLGSTMNCNLFPCSIEPHKVNEREIKNNLVLCGEDPNGSLIQSDPADGHILLANAKLKASVSHMNTPREMKEAKQRL